jgi:tetratricopeptide (TPR) repeat protein
MSDDDANQGGASGLGAGDFVGPYELVRLLGAGGMAEVWLARRADGAFKREVALKLPLLTRRALEISPQSDFSLNDLGTLQLLEGRAKDALETFRRIDNEGFRLSSVAMAEHTLGHARESQQALAQLIAQHATEAAFQIAETYAWRGETDKAFEWLERAYRQRDGGLSDIKTDPPLAALRNDPRYKVFLRKMDLPE